MSSESPTQFSHIELVNFAEALRSRTGISIPRQKFHWLDQCLKQAMLELKIATSIDLFQVFENDPVMLSKVISFVTINESFLWRDKELLKVFSKHFLPNIMVNQDEIKIWSAACSTGDEPATLAVICAHVQSVLEDSSGPGGDWSILASDIDQLAVEKAKAFSFDLRKMKNVPSSMIDQYFDRVGSQWNLKSTLSHKIQLMVNNLVQIEPAIQAEVFDFVFLRNVLIYFDQEIRTRVAENVSKLLKPGGVLFLGHAESLPQSRDLPFEKQMVEGVPVYIKLSAQELRDAG